MSSAEDILSNLIKTQLGLDFEYEYFHYQNEPDKSKYRLFYKGGVLIEFYEKDIVGLDEKDVFEYIYQKVKLNESVREYLMLNKEMQETEIKLNAIKERIARKEENQLHQKKKIIGWLSHKYSSYKLLKKDKDTLLLIELRRKNYKDNQYIEAFEIMQKREEDKGCN